MPEMNNDARMDRLERAMELLLDSQKQLLTAQVALTDEVQTGFRELRTVVADNTVAISELRAVVAQNTAAIAELRTSQAVTDERFRALIDTLRNPPRN